MKAKIKYTVPGLTQIMCSMNRDKINKLASNVHAKVVGMTKNSNMIILTFFKIF